MTIAEFFLPLFIGWSLLLYTFEWLSAHDIGWHILAGIVLGWWFAIVQHFIRGL